ncbi:MAG: cell wall metabolism sensor histidine kinase WalK [Clostridia bacterium]|nr:cell wall metabolism sensor histidine kinase WalK [Clostridia bacterium]
MAITISSLNSSFTDERSKELLRKANITAVHIDKSGYLDDYEDNEDFYNDINQTSIESSARVIVCNLNGEIIADSSNKDLGKLYIIKEVLLSLDGDDTINVSKNKITISVPIKDEKETTRGCVFIEDTSTTLANITELISTNIIFTSIIICALSILIVYLATGFITGPLKNMLKVIDKMSDSKFEEKIKVRGHDELAELGMAFNQMSARLMKVDANRQEFVSNVSHELKTPLSSMKVLIESLLLQDNVPEEMYKEFLGDTNSEIDRLTDIINHLLTIVKMDVKVLPLNIENENMNELIRGIIKRLTPLANKKNLTLEFNEEKEDVMCDVDKINITLAISNLIENGIKYTDEGGVNVTLDSDHQNMYITVRDTGIGLEEEELNKIFDRFYRVDKTRDRQTGGTGLGLAITHRAIILHNGSIKVTSEVNVGTTFVIRIPLKKQDK